VYLIPSTSLLLRTLLRGILRELDLLAALPAQDTNEAGQNRGIWQRGSFSKMPTKLRLARIFVRKIWNAAQFPAPFPCLLSRRGEETKRFSMTLSTVCGRATKCGQWRYGEEAAASRYKLRRLLTGAAKAKGQGPKRKEQDVQMRSL
jgi:hypothetical protein